MFQRLGLMTLACLMSVSSLAQNSRSDYSFYTDVRDPSLTAEYMHRLSPKDKLISVQVFGAVKNPGVYYIPDDTDLVKLLTLTGGTKDNSDLDEVIVRKKDQKQWLGVSSNYLNLKKGGAYEVEFTDLIKNESSGAELRMGNQDFVFVPERKSWISQDLSRSVTVVSVLLTAVLTGILISNQYE